eukprot:TRINITY_DN284_c0_g2_i1.p2 TRINITY_DN284_c0_g2~~TRINITY_DN284_c0_g2_i1.p2  ORF type:complete len:114 (+),score=26.05 TRINITY_DN284_c0_g2_i1:386-727(+)
MVEDDWLSVEVAEIGEENIGEIPDADLDTKNDDDVDIGDDEDIPDIEDFDEENNLVDEDPVSNVIYDMTDKYRLRPGATHFYQLEPMTLVSLMTSITKLRKFGCLDIQKPNDH